jgi:hypothetical protein
MIVGYNEVISFLGSGPTLEECQQRLPSAEEWKQLDRHWTLLHHMVYTHPTRSLSEAMALFQWFKQTHPGPGGVCVYPPLHLAARNPSLTMVKALIHCGEDVHAIHSNGATVLETAYIPPRQNERRSVVMYLIDKGVGYARLQLPDYAMEFIACRTAIRKECILLLAIGRSHRSPILRRYTDRGILGLIARTLWMLRWECPCSDRNLHTK